MSARLWCAIGAAVAAASTATATPARADEHPPLDRAALAARLASDPPRLRAARARAAVADAEVDVAGVRPNPTIGWDREAVPARDAHDDFVRLSIPFDPSGRRGLRRGAARAEADAERADADHIARDVAHDAYAAYAAAAHARQKLAVLDAARAQLDELVATLAARARGGDAAELDAARAGLELDLLDDLRASVRRERDDAERRLAAALGERGGYTAIEDLRVAEIPTAREATRADVAAARHRAEAATRAARAAEHTWVPQLEISVGLLLSADAASGGTDPGYVVGISGDLPLFNRGQAEARRARALAAAWTAEAATRAITANAEADRARTRLAALVEHVRVFDAGPRARATTLVRRMTSAYRDGARDLLDVIDAHRAARETELRALDLLLDTELARLELARSEGSLP